MQKSARSVHWFAQRQGGHITRGQLEESGLSKRAVADWVAAGKLIRIHHGVYAVGHVPTNPISRAHAALLAGGPDAALAGGCALVLWSIWRRWPHRAEIVLAGDRRPAGVIVHRSGTLAPADITLVQGLRVTSPARTMLDTATRLSARQRVRAINDLRLRGLLTVEQLEDILERNPTHRAVTLLRSQLELAQPEPTRSVIEDDLLPLLRAHGLPLPQINVHVAGYRVDAYFPEHALVVELDGWGSHRTKHRFLEDRRQDFAILARTGIPTVRLPSEDVGNGAIARLGELLEARAGKAA